MYAATDFQATLINCFNTSLAKKNQCWYPGSAGIRVGINERWNWPEHEEERNIVSIGLIIQIQSDSSIKSCLDFSFAIPAFGVWQPFVHFYLLLDRINGLCLRAVGNVEIGRKNFAFFDRENVHVAGPSRTPQKRTVNMNSSLNFIPRFPWYWWATKT